MSKRTQGKGSARRPAAKPGLYADNYEDIKGFGRKQSKPECPHQWVYVEERDVWWCPCGAVRIDE